MGRPISSVQLGVARFFAEVSDRVSDADLAAWVRSFARGLVFQKPELNEYAADLLHDVEAYRIAESERKAARFPKIPPESAGIRGLSRDSEHSKTVNQSINQSVSKKERTQGATRPKFARPTLEQVAAYCFERKNAVDPQKFFDHYEANGWVQGKNKPIKNWQACVRTWEQNDFQKPAKPSNRIPGALNRKGEHDENLKL